MKSNPNALISTQKNTIFTNVVHNLDDNTVWWEGLDKNPPKNALNWKGEKWDCTDGSKGAHPNSRFTAPAVNCPCISSEFNNPNGVPISAMISSMLCPFSSRAWISVPMSPLMRAFAFRGRRSSRSMALT